MATESGDDHGARNAQGGSPHRWVRRSKPQSVGPGAWLVPWFAALDLPHALVKWVTRLIVTSEGGAALQAPAAPACPRRPGPPAASRHAWADRRRGRHIRLQAVTDPEGRLLWLSPTRPGRTRGPTTARGPRPGSTGYTSNRTSPAWPDRARQGAGPRSPPGSNGHPAANHPTHHSRRPRTGPGPSAPSNAARHGPKPAPHQPVTAQPSSPTPSPPCRGTTLNKAHRRSADCRYTTRCAPPPCGRTRSKRKTQRAVTGGYLLCASRDCAFA
ncbi:hypothetical protein SUDANB54_06898 [Streptomyces sp. enrichment culture]